MSIKITRPRFQVPKDSSLGLKVEIARQARATVTSAADIIRYVLRGRITSKQVLIDYARQQETSLRFLAPNFLLGTLKSLRPMRSTLTEVTAGLQRLYDEVGRLPDINHQHFTSLQTARRDLGALIMLITIQSEPNTPKAGELAKADPAPTELAPVIPFPQQPARYVPYWTGSEVVFEGVF